MRFRVAYEARLVGALGVFEWRSVVINADTAAIAGDLAFIRLHDEGFETRNGPITRETDSHEPRIIRASIEGEK